MTSKKTSKPSKVTKASKSSRKGIGEAKKLSNPFSTGGGGGLFEARVQASFVALMVTGGYAPGMPTWPITKIKLQGRIDGYETDDLIVYVEHPDSGQVNRLICQVKHTVHVRKKDPTFAQVMHAAWRDFKNSDVFIEGKDAIALITGPLTATDSHTIHWLTTQAGQLATPEEFFAKVDQANYGPSNRAEKLGVIRGHLTDAKGSSITDIELHQFLKSFRVLGYDLDSDSGVVLSLLHSHLSLEGKNLPRRLWGRIVEEVQSRNSSAGYFTLDNCPEDFLEHRRAPGAQLQPPSLLARLHTSASLTIPNTAIARSLALLNLVGGWSDKAVADHEVVALAVGESYAELLLRSREVESITTSPVRFNLGQWSVTQRQEVWDAVASELTDADIRRFGQAAKSVLEEIDPTLELSQEERFSSSLRGKYSPALRKSLAETLSLITNRFSALTHCTDDVRFVPERLVRDILKNADWKLWASLNDLMPLLAEAAPRAFLDAVQDALIAGPSLFLKIFSQESNGITGRSYLTGLLWGLEGLAWDENRLPAVCLLLVDLADSDPGGSWSNRPINSLIAILLPWLPQTSADENKRISVVQSIVNEKPNVAWNLLSKLLPNQTTSSSPTHRPMFIPTPALEPAVSNAAYWQQIERYVEMIIELVRGDHARALAIVPLLDDMPPASLDTALQMFSTDVLPNSDASQKLDLWEALNRFIGRHRRFRDANWALPDALLKKVEEVATQFEPQARLQAFRPLFSGRDIDFYEPDVDWKEQRSRIERRRIAAVEELLSIYDLNAVVGFAKTVEQPGEVGFALARLKGSLIDEIMLPAYLDTKDSVMRQLVHGYINTRRFDSGWEWIDSLPVGSWSEAARAEFFLALPFADRVWKLVDHLLAGKTELYWSVVTPNAYNEEGDMQPAIEELLKVKRPKAVVSLLNQMIHGGRSIRSDDAATALLEASSSSAERSVQLDGYEVGELIKRIQNDEAFDAQRLFQVEWIYMQLLDGHSGVLPKELWRNMAQDPSFFVQLLKLVYKSKDIEDEKIEGDAEQIRRLATNAWHLLRSWKMVPGAGSDDSFDQDIFDHWLADVEKLSVKAGRADVAQMQIGHLLAHSPPEVDGLWIHPRLAAVLDTRDRKAMRDGFATEVFNSRGAFWVDPTGNAEVKLAEGFEEKARAVEDRRFFRLAQTLREIAASYRRQGAQTAAEHQPPPDNSGGKK